MDQPKYKSAADFCLHTLKDDTPFSEQHYIYQYTLAVWEAAAEWTKYKIENNINDELPKEGECF